MRQAPGRGGTVAEDTGAAQPGRTRVAAARGAWAVGSLLLAIARLVRLATFIAVGIIVAAIILRVVGANGANTIVHDVHAAGRWLVQPFKDVFSVKKPKESIALNWGLAALIYLIVGSLIASLIGRMAPSGVHPSQRVA
jgi:hypothetical protein